VLTARATRRVEQRRSMTGFLLQGPAVRRNVARGSAARLTDGDELATSW